MDKRATLYVASLSFTTIYYVLRRQTKAANARAAVAQLAKLVTVVAVDAAVVQQAIASDWADFEDGIQYFTALSVPHADALATRNARDFTPSTLAILTPQQAVGNFTF